MSNERLVQFYERNYAHEASGSTRVVSLSDTPGDRFEACVHYIMRESTGPNILEVGGGDGTIARSLVKAGLKFSRYTLTDLSPTRAAGAASSFDDSRFNGFQLDVEEGLGALAGRYDAIIMTALIEHLIDPIAAMKNIRALLSEGGFVYIDTPNLAKYTRRIKLLLGQFPSTSSTDEGLTTYSGKPVSLYDEGHLHYFTFRSLSEMLKRYCGFRDVVQAPYWAGRRYLPARASHQLAKAWPEMFSELAVIARL
jgi:SAM-dependent methyltransferase